MKATRARFLALLALSCSLAATNTAHAQSCPTATISYAESTVCGTDGGEIVRLNGTPGGTFSSTAGLQLNASSGTIVPSSSTAGTYTVHYMIPADGSCPAVDASTQITIMDRPMVNPVPNPAVCAGSTVNVASFTSNIPGATFTWTNDDPTIGLPASGTGDIPAFTGLNSTDGPKKANIAVYATYTMNGVTCTSFPMRFAIFVNPVPQVGTIANMTYCSGETTAPFTIPGPTTGPGVRYIWTSDNVAIGMPRSGNDVIPAFTALNATGVAQTATVTVTPYYYNGSRCAGTPTTFTITVNPSPAGTATFSYPGSPYCPVGAVSPTFTGPTGGRFYSVPEGLSISPFTGNVNTSLSTPNTYTVYYTYNNAAGCSFINTATITINNAQVSIRYASDAYCNRQVTTLYPTIRGTMGGTFSAPAGLSINPTTGGIDLATSTKGDYNVSYSVNTPDCGNVVVQTQVRIIESATVTPMPNREVCSGGTVPAMNFTSPNVAGASFSWTIIGNVNIGLPLSGNGDLPSFVAVNNGTTPLDAYVRVVARNVNGNVSCSGSPMVFRIRVFPVATVDPAPNQVVCQSAGATAPVVFSNSTGSNTGMTYTWLNNNTGIGLAASGTGNLPSFNPQVGSANIFVRVKNSYGCTSAPMGFAYDVNACGNTPVGTTGSSATARTRTAAVTTDGEQNTASEMVTSPNPTRSRVTVSYKGGNTVTLRVLDLNGNAVKTIRGFNSNNSVNVSDLRPGNYVIQLVDEHKNTVMQRNIVKL